ncbi:MAG: hypothetical protein ACP5VP_07645 [Candidatus Limnocylindrales bacterium]
MKARSFTALGATRATFSGVAEVALEAAGAAALAAGAALAGALEAAGAALAGALEAAGAALAGALDAGAALATGAALEAGAGVLLLPQAAATRAAIVSRMGTAERCTCRCMVGSSSDSQDSI